MRKLKYILMALLAVLVGTSALQAARPSAKSVVETAASRLRKAPSVKAAFSVAAASGNSRGALTVAGKRFVMDTPDLKVWFDGKTQWAYSPSGGEVNVTEPTASELAASNPLSVLTNMTTAYNCKRLSSSATADRIELVPRGKADISKAVITFSTSTGYPTDIVVTGTDRSVTKIHITSLTTGKALPEATFRFNASKFPGVEVVDLR